MTRFATSLCSLAIASAITIHASPLPPQSGASLSFSTFLGGQKVQQSRGMGIALDRNGGLVVTGRTQAEDFPLANAAQSKYGGGGNDAFVTKYAVDGQSVLFSTFLGGSEVDFSEDVAVDDSGNIYIAGTTYSKNFPTTKSVVQRSYGGGDRDCFVAKLSRDGALVYSTLLGGNATDRCVAIAVDSQGNAYVTGSTNSKNWISDKVMGSLGPKKDWDVFVAKLDPTGSQRLYGLRFGGSSGSEPAEGGYGGEFGTDIVIDDKGTVYVSGHTDSPDFPEFRPLRLPLPFGGGRLGGFVAAVDAAGAARIVSTWPGWFFDCIALDGAGNVYVAGRAHSFSQNGQASIVQGTGSPVVMNLTAGTSSLVGLGTVAASISDLAVVQGNAYIIGTTTARDLPLVSPLQQQLGGPGRQTLIVPDAFVAKIDLTRKAISFSTYLGGSTFDEGHGLAVDSAGAIFVTGLAGYGGGASFNDFPTVRALQTTRSTIAAFVAKITTGRLE